MNAVPENISHVFLTRFNLPTKGKEQTIREREGWLIARFKLFETFCLPSMAGQVESNFSWIVYFDSETPEEFKTRVVKIQQQYSFLKPQWVRSAPLSRVRDDIRQFVLPTSQYVLTTRIDNDDAIHSEFCSNLYAAIEQNNVAMAVFNFPSGLVWQSAKLFRHTDKSNAFTSLLEPVGSLKTIWSEQHPDLSQSFRLIQIDTSAMWLQVVHGENVSNRVRGRRVGQHALSGFRVEVDAKPVRPIKVLLDNCLATPIRYLKEFVRLILKRSVMALKPRQRL